jgi:hypothetical protein
MGLNAPDPSRENLPDRMQRRLAIIESQIHRMEDIIQHYLSHSRGSVLKVEIRISDLVRKPLRCSNRFFSSVD